MCQNRPSTLLSERDPCTHETQRPNKCQWLLLKTERARTETLSGTRRRGNANASYLENISAVKKV